MKKYLPTVLSVISIGGLCGASVLSAYSTIKAIKLIEAEKREKGVDGLTKKEIINTTWKCYIPTIGMVVVTGGCIFMSNTLNKKQQASILASYGVLQQAFSNYRKSVNHIYGEDADIAVAKDILETDDGADEYYEDYDSDKDDIILFDMESGKYISTTKEKFKNAMTYVNTALNNCNTVYLNDFYEKLGKDAYRAYGDFLGWDKQTDKVHFEVEPVIINGGMEIHILSMSPEPYFPQ